jgi:pimeloyl-ACP methyl ester carboxylesterase
MARDVLADSPDRFALAGLSLGGIVALEMWRNSPTRISHLALLDTNPAAEAGSRRASRAVEIEAAKCGQLTQLMIREFKPKYLAESAKQNVTLLEDILQMATSLGVDVFERQSIALRDRPDSRGMLKTIDCPSAVICGAEDSLCSPELHRELASAIAGSELTIIDDCGHLSSLEQPEAVTRALLRLLRRH